MHYNRLLLIITTIVIYFVYNITTKNIKELVVPNHHHILERELECQFKCGSGECIPHSDVCDGDRDCEDGLDEKSCSISCAPNQLSCNDGECIDLAWKCDGESDCEDGSDEHNCSSSTVSPSKCSIDTQFDCGDNDHQCIPFIKVCDGIRDCKTSSDETIQACSKYACYQNNGGCSHNCTISPVGKVCSCLNGYALKRDMLCEDINECYNVNSCSQICTNEIGSFKCSCTDGYEIDHENPKHCKSKLGRGFLLLGRKFDIRKLSLSRSEVTQIISNISYVTAMDFDYSTKTIFWFDFLDDKIYKASINNDPEKVVILSNVLIRSFALDWISKHIYYSNPFSRFIKILDVNGPISMHIILIEKNVNAKKIVLDPIKGHKQKILVFKDLPNDLVLDFIKERIYWVDQFSRSIFSCNYDGSDAKFILRSIHGLENPYSITLFENSVYWSESKHEKIYKANKLSGELLKFGYSNTDDHPIIQVYHPDRQPNVTNHCKLGGCSHYCLPIPKPYYHQNLSISCACPDNFVLSYDNSTCVRKSCGPDSFTCRNLKCISLTLVCDGDDDCKEGEDEIDCGPQNCTKNQFACDNGQCIQRTWICDGNTDCHDGSDEKNCTHICDIKKQMQCEDPHECISIEWRCDGKKDCVDGSDESGCSTLLTCPDHMYKCKNIWKCINSTKLCDGTPDCLNDDDEDPVICKNNTSIAPVKCDDTKEFNCGNGTCIPLSKVCDHHQDCLDSSDEPSTCNFDFCKDNNGGCPHKCISSRGSFHCECHEGYELVNDKLCEDINECETPGACSQICANTIGSFTCQCLSGYFAELNNPNLCKAEIGNPYLIFSRRHDIRKFQFHNSEMTDIVTNLRHVSKLDFDYKTNTIFWCDGNNNIYRALIENGENITRVPVNTTYIEHIAVDWVYNHLYWTNPAKGTIELSDFEGKLQTVLIESIHETPLAIALDPIEGWMFWTNQFTRTIKRAGMDGSNKETILEHHLWPSDFTLDLVARKVYWIDGYLKTISSCDYEGRNRRSILTANEIRYPYTITIFEDLMYWTDTRKDGGKIYKANKFNGKNIQEVLRTSDPKVVRVIHPYVQPNGTNHCSLNNGNCSHLCLPAPQITPQSPLFSCACPVNFTMMPNKFTCILLEISEHIEAPSSGYVTETVILVLTILITIGCIIGFTFYKRNDIYDHFKNKSRFQNLRYTTTNEDNFSLDHDEHQE